MEKEYDIVLIGAGHNALVCAAYLAKAGKKVIVLERLPYIGGGVVTVDGEGVEVPGVDHIVGKTLPGFKHNLHSTFHEWIFQGPVYWELELEKYGSKYIWQDRTCAMVFSDGSSIIHWQDLDRMVKEIEYFSPKDAKEYRNFINEWMDTARFLVAMWFNPPLPDSTIYAQLEGTPLGKELARNLKCSIRQLVTERFESVHLRTLMCYEASQAGVPDDDLGSGMVFGFMYPLLQRSGVGWSVGGSGSLSKGLANYVKAHGGDIHINSPVKSITIENKKAVGVELEDGTKIKALNAVASNLTPHLTFVDLVGEENLESEFLKQVKRYRPDELSMFGPHLCLNEPPLWKACEKKPELAGTVGVIFGFDNVSDIQDQYNDIRVGIPPRLIGGNTCTPTNVDPTQAPPGKHTSFLWQYAPYSLKEGGPQKWEEIKEEYTDTCMEVWREYAPNMTPDNILARYLHSPYDITQINISMIGGSMMCGSPTQDQWGSLRPFYGYSPYKTPIESLYICGPSAPSGGGCSGAAGYNAAGVIADDLGLKRWWKPASIGK